MNDLPTNEFANEIQSTLYPKGLQTDPLDLGINTPFALLRVGETGVILHLIDAQTYASSPAVSPLFFQRLSDYCTANGWRLIHLWEDVWRQKPAVVLSRLSALAGLSERIPARLTRVRRIDRPTTERFLDANHLQVAVQSKYKYGLFLPNRYFRVLSPAYQQQLPPDLPELLVAVATFAHPRQVKRLDTVYRSMEMVRFANLLNCTVVGGLDKLIKTVVINQQPDDLMTYADRDWSDGRSYEKLHFTRVELTEPQAFWLRPGEWIRYYPHRLPAGLTEADMAANGYLTIYNSGSLKFIKLLAPDRVH